MEGMTPVQKNDMLDQDPDIRGQKYVCLSFVSPEDVLVTKEPFMLSKFLGGFSKEMSELFDNLKEYFKDNNTVLESIGLIRQRYGYIYEDTELQKEFEFFKEKNNKELEDEFYIRNQFRTSMRGIKVRGSYDTIEEAKARVEAIQKFDKNFNVYVAQVGCWCPWSPYPDTLQDQHYAETALNSLVKAYSENASAKEEVYVDRKQSMIDKMQKDMQERKDLWMAAKDLQDAEQKKDDAIEEKGTDTIVAPVT